MNVAEANNSTRNLAEFYFGVGGHYGLDFTRSEIMQARSAFECALFPMECLSILGCLRGILEHLVSFRVDDVDEVTAAENHAWENLAEIYTPEDLVYGAAN